MPGTGKSTLGKAVAKSLAMTFVDTDTIMESIAGKPLQQVLNQSTAEFTKIEEQALIESPKKDHVIATGGSAIYCKEALLDLRENAVVLHLIANVDALKRRIGDFTSRGIVMAEGMTFDDLYNERMPLYTEMADVELKTDKTNASVASLVSEIVDLYQQTVKLK